MDQCTELTCTADGNLRKEGKAIFRLPGGCRAPSTMEVVYSLDQGSPMLRVVLQADWQEQGGETIPVLTWKTPVTKGAGSFRYLIPSGSILRGPIHNDVPGTAAAALRREGPALIMTSDSKYGFRGAPESLTMTLINSAVNPDPYPERGVHHMTLWLGAGEGSGQALRTMTDDACHRLIYQPARIHSGALPARLGMLEVVSGQAAVSSIRMENGALLIRGYETAGQAGVAQLRLNLPVCSAALTDLSEKSGETPLSIQDGLISVPLRPCGIWLVRIQLQG